MKKQKSTRSGMLKNSILSIREEKRSRIVFLALFSAVVLAMGYIFKSYLWPFLFAVVFYVALKPFYDFLRKKTGIRWLSAFITVLLFVLLIVMPLLFLMLALADQTFQFYQFVAERFDPAAIKQIIYNDETTRALLKKLGFHESDLIQKLVSLLQGASLDLFSNITDMVSFSLKFIVNFFFMILILFSIFMDGPRLGEMVYNIIPFPRDIEKVILKRLREVIRVLVAGNLAIMVMQGVFVSAGFLIFGAEMPLLAGAVAAVFSLIPVVGTSFVWIPAAVYFAVTGHLIRAALICAWCVFWYLFLENWIKPKFFGEKLNFHPVIFFLLLIGSLGAFNLPGIIIGPVLLTLFYSLWEIYRFLYLEDPGAVFDDECVSKEKKKNKSASKAGN